MIHERMKEERQRLGFTQPDFAAVAGSAKRTLIDWEKGVSSPTAVQLSAFSGIGVDVLYVLTGVRSSTVAQETATYTALNGREAALLDNYRHIADEGDRRAVERMALLAARASHGEQESGAKRKAV